MLLLATDALRRRYNFASGPATRAAMQAIADQLLPRHVSLLFDGIHLRRQNRDQIRALAARLRRRQLDPAATVRAGKFVITPAHFDRLAGYLEPPAPAEADVLTVDTGAGALWPQLAPLTEMVANCYPAAAGANLEANA